MKNAEDALRSGPFLVISGDALTDIDLSALVQAHKENGALVTVAGGALARSQGSQTLFVVAGCVGLAACVWAWAVGLGSLRVDDAVQ